jgi:UDP-N-acetylmuramoyl-tripeptide--D-alanyl-D-alanine ligase
VFSGLNLPKYRGEEVRRGERLFVADCYNANPDSMLRSIDNFVKKGCGAAGDECYLILGDMAELGDFSEKFHRELVKYIKTLKVVSKSFLIGEEFEKIGADLMDDDRLVFYGSIAELEAALPARGRFLVKGSRRNRLESLFDMVGGR